MKLKVFFVLILLVFTAAGVSAVKLGMTDRLSGTYVVTFNTSHGDIKVFLPDDMAGGDTVSASIFAYPEGANNSSVLNSYKIHTDVQSASVQEGRITINIPRNMSGSSLRVTLRDESNREISYSSAAVKLPDSFTDGPETPTPFDFETPLIGQAGRLIEIKGPFDGDFSTTELTIGGKPAHVISESPRKLIFEAPPGLSGSAEIVLNEKGVLVKRPFTSLRVVKIGEESTSTASGIVPKGYRSHEPATVSPVQTQSPPQITEETVVTEVTSTEPGIVEEELSIDGTGVQEEILLEQSPKGSYAQPGRAPVNAEIALLLDAQLNAPLEGGANLIKAEKIDTVVLRKADTSEEFEETESGEQLTVKSYESEIIEEDILVTEKKAPPLVRKKDPPAAPRSTDTDDASYSSKELIERIYESTRDDWDKPPPEVSGREKVDTNKNREPVSRAEATKIPSGDSSPQGRGKYTVQLASFKDPAAAGSFAQKLERKGYKVRVTTADVPGKGRWSRVSVGAFPTKGQAIEYGNWLKRKEPGVKSVYITQIK